MTGTIKVTKKNVFFGILFLFMMVLPCRYGFTQQSDNAQPVAVTVESPETEAMNLYMVNPLDEVVVVVYAGEKQISEYRKYIQSDGTLYLPFLEKDVKIGGMKVLEAQKYLEELAQKYIKSPRIVITVTSSSNQSVSTYGKIDNRTIDMKVPMRILHLMARVGGPKEGARTDSIKVISRNGDLKIFNYDKVNKNPNDKNNFYLKPGDIVYVPDEENMNVFIIGDVLHAGAYSIKDDKNVIDALLKAGSWNSSADIKKIRLVRNVKGKQVYIKKINLQKVLNDGNPEQNYLLKDGDIIYVPAKKTELYYQSMSIFISSFASAISAYAVLYSISHN